MSNALALAPRNGAEIEHDTRTTARVVESMVLRGDISALNPEERARYYIQFCTQLGLNPASQPLAVLKLNGKEVLYPTRGATDQLAAVHRLNREVVEGPELRKFGTVELLYCKVRVTHPNGRVETSVATLPGRIDENSLMKLETKAKRRGTLSILGLGMLDESEIESIPASSKEEVPQWVEVKRVDPDDLDPEREAIEQEPALPALPSLTERMLSCGTLEGLSELGKEAASLKKGSKERVEAVAAMKTRRAQIEAAATGAAGE